jgi:hypothetical protein
MRWFQACSEATTSTAYFSKRRRMLSRVPSLAWTTSSRPGSKSVLLPCPALVSLSSSAAASIHGPPRGGRENREGLPLIVPRAPAPAPYLRHWPEGRYGPCRTPGPATPQTAAASLPSGWGAGALGAPCAGISCWGGRANTCAARVSAGPGARGRASPAWGPRCSCRWWSSLRPPRERWP